MTENRRALERQVANKHGIDINTYREFFDEVWRDADELGESFASHEDFEAFVDYRLRYCVMFAGKSISSNRSPDSNEATSDNYQQGDSGSTRGEREDYEVHFDDNTKLRALALSEYLAKIAATDRRVMHLRKRICGDVQSTFDSEREALDFLEDHSAASHADQGWKASVDEAETLRWPTGVYGKRFTVSESPLLKELKRVADYLAKHYPWKDYQAAHFILCGGVPQAATVMGGYSASTNKGVPAHKFDRMTIKLEVEHWIPAEFVREAFCKIRDKAVNDRDMLAQVSLQRAGFRNMEIFRFVVSQSYFCVKDTKQALGRLELPSWPELKDRWNAQLPQGDSRHYKEVKYFRRDFQRAQRAILGSERGLPGVPGQPMTRAELQDMHQKALENR